MPECSLGLEATKKLDSSKKFGNAYFYAVVAVRGRPVGDKKRRRRTMTGFIRFPSQREVNRIYPGANHVSYAAGLAAKIFAMRILDLKAKGVYPPEAIDGTNRRRILKELKSSPITITIKTKRK
jgi:hypothetical protein